jgi:hypothetical protein
MSLWVRKKGYIALCTLLLWGMPAAAEQISSSQPFTYQETLYFSWAGFGLGELTLKMQQENDRYQMQTDAKSSGLLRLFSRHHSLTTVSGKITADAAYLPEIYRSEYNDSGEKKRIEIQYSEEGVPVKETLMPPREEIRPLVAEEAKKQAVDILSGFFQMRAKLIQALQKGEKNFSVTIYDGKRLFRVDARIESTAQNVLIHSTKTLKPSLKLILQRVALAGYKEKELKNIAKRNPPIALYVEPERLVPFGLSLKVYGAKLEAWIKPKPDKQ